MAEVTKKATVDAVTAPVANAPVTSIGPSVDFDSLQHITAASIANTIQRGGSGALSMNVVYSETNGKRVKLSKALFEALGSPKQVQVAQSGNRLIIGEKLPNATQTFAFSKGTGFNILYRPALVHWLIDTFGLKYKQAKVNPEGCVSKSFGDIELGSKDVNGVAIKFAVIDMTDSAA